MDPSVIRKTQDTLGKVIKKPPLTDKLLNKPPFRFLHDIITEVIKTSGVLKGLFKADELNSDNVKDKEAKMIFLQKAIDCVGILTGQVLSVRPSKIVAGHEPEKTNEFLQALGKACMKKMDSSDAVKKTLAGDKPASAKSRIKESTRSAGSKKEVEKSKEKDTKKEDKGGDGRREKSGTKGGREEKDKGKKKEKGGEKSKESEKELDSNLGNKAETISQSPTNNREIEDEAGTSTKMPRPSSAKGQRRRPPNSETEKDDKAPTDETVVESGSLETKEEAKLLDEDSTLRQPSASKRSFRPSSARPAPPKVKKNDEIQDPLPRVESGKQLNTVIIDNMKDDDDDDDLFVVEDNSQNESFLHVTTGDNDQNEVDDGQHGSLVKKMLDSKRDAEIVQSKGLQNKDKPIIDATRKKEKELAQKEIEKLRNSIQTLCRSAHPLGKIMDYLQEDIDSMQKELDVWRKENKKYSLALKAEQSVTEAEIEPLLAKLNELELEITDMVDRISSVKSNIIRNDEKIKDMIGGVSR